MLLNYLKQNIRTGWQVAVYNSRSISSASCHINKGTSSVLSPIKPINGALFQQIRESNSFFNRRTFL